MIRKTLASALLCCAVGAMVVVPTTALAQSSQGGLRGTVKDSQGVIPGVTVTLTNESTNITRETVTNERGEYSFPAVDPATYTVRCEVQGFKTFERNMSARSGSNGITNFPDTAYSAYSAYSADRRRLGKPGRLFSFRYLWHLIGVEKRGRP